MILLILQIRDFNNKLKNVRSTKNELNEPSKKLDQYVKMLDQYQQKD